MELWVGRLPISLYPATCETCLCGNQTETWLKTNRHKHTEQVDGIDKKNDPKTKAINQDKKIVFKVAIKMGKGGEGKK